MHDKILASFSSKLRQTVGVDTAVNLMVLCVLCGIPDLEYWWEQSRVTFKYATLRKDIPGMHKTIAKLLDSNANAYSRWSANESHDSSLNLMAEEVATNQKIKSSMIEWQVNHRLEMTEKSNKLDPYVFKRFVLDPRHYLHLDKYGEKIPSWEKPQYRKWLSNSEFKLLAKSLGGGNNLLDQKCICMGCGKARRSWKHITKTCPILQNKKSMIPDLEKLPESKRQCKIQLSKLRKLVKFFEAKTDVNLCKRQVRILSENGEINQYYVTRMFYNYDYRVMNIQTNEFSKLQLQKLNRQGKLFII